MIADFTHVVPWIFVIIDNLWQLIVHLYWRLSPAPTSCGDSALITMAVVSDCHIWERETQVMQEWTAYRHLFSCLPEHHGSTATGATSWVPQPDSPVRADAARRGSGSLQCD